MEPDPHRAVTACRQAGLQVLAADAARGRDLDDIIDAGSLAAPTAWLFGNEVHGMDRDLLAAADYAVAIPLYGRAESLNLATAAAICLYASARAHRRQPAAGAIT
jgi:TrmH family RNA methyltransferase